MHVNKTVNGLVEGNNFLGIWADNAWGAEATTKNYNILILQHAFDCRPKDAATLPDLGSGT